MHIFFPAIVSLNIQSTDVQIIRRKQILVAPLDWGLGHAARSSRIISLLRQAGADVCVAGSGQSLTLLEKEFPGIRTFKLPGYRVSYVRSDRQTAKIITQIPRLIRVIRSENQTIRQILRSHPFDGIISDNRYGVYVRQVPSVFICHQLSPMLPKSWRWLEPAVANLHQKFLRPFDQIWIPDDREIRLSGRLSNLQGVEDRILFTGPLSRFQSLSGLPVDYGHPVLNENPPEITVILSGPEPQRTLLEEMIRKQAAAVSRTIWLIRGQTQENEITRHNNLISIPHLSTPVMAKAMRNSHTLISRSGYSSLMDYHALGIKNTVLVPTPGQTEQEYLAETLSNAKGAVFISQENFSLREAGKVKIALSDEKIQEIEKKQEALIGNYLANLL
ncbi:MAG: glycosyltransferase [Bacteroidia bacterium]